MTNEQLIEELKSIGNKLLVIASNLARNDPEEFPGFAQQLVDRQLCLNCKLPYDGKIVRGLHERCVKSVYEFAEEKGIDREQLVSFGMLAPKNPGGRKKKENSESSQILEDIVDPKTELDKVREKAKLAAEQALRDFDLDERNEASRRQKGKTKDPIEMLKESRSHTKEEWAKFLIKKNEELSKKTEKPKPKKEPK